MNKTFIVLLFFVSLNLLHSQSFSVIYEQTKAAADEAAEYAGYITSNAYIMSTLVDFESYIVKNVELAYELSGECRFWQNVISVLENIKATAFSIYLQVKENEEESSDEANGAQQNLIALQGAINAGDHAEALSIRDSTIDARNRIRDLYNINLAHHQSLIDLQTESNEVFTETLNDCGGL